MKENARLIIPLWGRVYADKLTSMTLPALLAPGNLPSLCAMFEVEVVIVTETKLFDLIRNSRAFQRVATLCSTRLTPIDDLMSSLPGDYGVVLTKALYRGFLDLGVKVLDTFLLFLNADFIIADGSYRRLGELMLEGHRVIHAPSFRVILEDVWPKLETHADRKNAVLAISPREMVKMALNYKHLTVKARTVNQRFYHQWCMDQFYWYVDEDTLVGYQWPVALVAIKPERVVMEPTLVWDFAYIPDAAPTLEKFFIKDSDDFFMIEPQSRVTGEELIRPGWITIDGVVKYLNNWTTKEQRHCGEQLLVFHADDLPAGLDAVIDESRKYMSEIAKRLSPESQPHVNHRMLGPWFAAAVKRINEGQAVSVESADQLPQDIVPMPRTKPLALRRGIMSKLSARVRAIHCKMFGSLPLLRPTHPLWLDTADVAAWLSAWRQEGRNRVLWLSSKDSFFHGLLTERTDATRLLLKQRDYPNNEDMPYDACLCELSPTEISNLPALYARIRPLVRDGAEVLFYVYKRGPMPLRANPFEAYEELFPAIDVSTIRFHGNTLTYLIRNLFIKFSWLFAHFPAARATIAGMTLLALAPLAWLANRQANRRDATIFTPTWTSTVVHFVVRKKPEIVQRTAGRVTGGGAIPEREATTGLYAQRP
jgi:hypothetical protein